jgi:hypothetical protein
MSLHKGGFVHDQRVTVTINVPLAALALLMLVVHLSVLFFQLGWLPPLPKFNLEEKQRTFQIKEIRTLGDKNSKIKDKVLVTKNYREEAKQDPFEAAANMNKPAKPAPEKKPQKEQIKKVAKTIPQPNPYRPNPRAQALEQLSLRAEPVQKVAERSHQGGGAAALGGSPTLTKSLMNMQVEVPEGVAADELNEFELMFYGFQKRLMEKYFSTIVLQVREYEKRYSLPTLMPEGRHTMTGRVTFDSEGNIKQIKMVRWTQADKLQAMFEDILKSMDRLPNPPKLLRNQDGEFVVFYTFTVNNT